MHEPQCMMSDACYDRYDLCIVQRDIERYICFGVEPEKEFKYSQCRTT